jgi:hypothetical protein
VGIHAPNRGFNEQDYARVAEGEFGTVKMMSYHPLESYARLRSELPHLQFFVRLDTPWHELPAPEQFVAANGPRLRTLVDAGYAPWVEIGNEPNLELHPQAERTYVAWFLEVLSLLRTAVPEARYGFPGLARDLREFDWLESGAAAVRAADWLGVHTYWDDEREMLDPRRALKLIEFHKRFPDKPIVVTEAGNHSVGGPSRERGEQYARFVRTLARLPYVHAVHFFILSGTGEWRRFFFDERMVASVRRAGADPLPPMAEWLGFRLPSRRVRLDRGQAADPGPALPTPTPARATPTPTPEPEAFFRRRLLVDPAPAGATLLAPAPGARWARLAPAASPAASARSASAYTVTDASIQLALAAPLQGEPFAIQIAGADLFAMSGPGGPASSALAGGASSTDRTGFALLWDGAAWRLQHYRQGSLLTDAHLANVPTVTGDDWLRIEIALEPRSAAAWVWHRGEPQPAQPNAVFAPPEAAALDGATARALFLPAHPLADVVLEGATRYS